ncbi:hypothetical protein EDB81DRAFT_452797 [Dactylonectria macrodidyma]|uniref:Uncharacterized protein n=1 Tax=Dactylonectria macrodidyma TaxID=307937 RepID=A0A9P9F5Q8_9HYPO|nr:hypothetical protein EDB81DRAFT_452797 [Dactylonectria macrodidyma]
MMRNRRCRSSVASLAVVLWAASIEAAEYRRFDGVHRIEKAQVTEPAVLAKRDDVCGTSMKLCPSSLDGGCCPDEYNCAKESCYATTSGPSTCGSLVGWYYCDPVYGAGCCPEGYMCQTADGCIPPSGSAYTYGCPTSQYLCPSSLSYGCCPNGMACATNQCYSTEPVTITNTIVITTTEDGSRTTYRTTSVTVATPTAPTVLPSVDVGNYDDQKVLKYFPAAVSKVMPTSSSDSDSGSGGLSTGALAGIIAGSVAFLIIVLVTAFIIIRHLNKVVAAVSTPRRSDASKSRPSMKDFKPTDSEGDTLSINPLMLPPRPPAPGPESTPSPYNLASPDYSSNDHTPSGGIAGYQPVANSAGNSRHTSFDAGANDDYFNSTSTALRFSQSTASAPRRSNDSHGTYTHVRNWSNASDGSDGAPGWNPVALGELEANPHVPELPHSPSSVAFPRDDRRRSSGGSTISNALRSSVSQQRQRNRSESLGQSALGVVDEEMHGFYGSANYLVGQTGSHRPGTARSKDRPIPIDTEGQGESQGDVHGEGSRS